MSQYLELLQLEILSYFTPENNTAFHANHLEILSYFIKNIRKTFNMTYFKKIRKRF